MICDKTEAKQQADWDRGASCWKKISAALRALKSGQLAPVEDWMRCYKTFNLNSLRKYYA